MKKRGLICAVSAVVLAVSVFLLAACQTYKWGPVAGGQPDAAVTSNGGYAVKQGDYLYFVNGYVGFPENPDIKYNYFGKAEKGSIMRSQVNSDGTLGEPVIVVPKNIMSSYTSGGFWIFGSWIYYVSPTTGVNNKKELQTDYLDYFRTSIDGTKTQLIGTLKGQSLEYKFTPTGMFYFIDNSIKLISYNEKKVGKESVIAEKVTGKVFPVNADFESSKTYLADYVFYTKAGEDDTLPGNELWVANSFGVNKRIYAQKDKLAEGEDAYANRSKLETLALKQVRVASDGIEIYYGKSRYIGGSSVDEGLYGKKFTSEEFDFKSAAEVRFTLTAPSAFYPVSLEEGIFVTGSEPYLARPMTGGEANYDKDSYKKLGSVTLLSIREATVDGVSGKFFFYIANNLYTCAPVSPSAQINAKILCEDKITTSFFTPDIVDGYLYFIATDMLTYTARVSVDGGEGQLLGKMTEADQKTWDEKQAEEDNK